MQAETKISPKKYGKREKIRLFRRSVNILLAILIIVCQHIEGVGEWYTQSVYPSVFALLNLLTGWIPISCEELLAVMVFIGLIVLVFLMVHERRKASSVLLLLGEGCLWIYIWFYCGWGLTYYRSSYFERSGIKQATYEEEIFKVFLKDYTQQLNNSHQTVFSKRNALPDSATLVFEATRLPSHTEKQLWQSQLQAIFRRIPTHYGLCSLHTDIQPKRLLFNQLYSSVGVMGYMGPFFCEMQLNEELPASQYPFTYAHELSHILGVSSEAEANFWAYRSCTESPVPAVRYSGYLGLLPYVSASARQLLETSDYHKWLKTINPAIILQAQARSRYWQERYSPTVGAIQDWCYNWYLKGNNISSGTKNYGEVVCIVLSEYQSKQL